MWSLEELSSHRVLPCICPLFYRLVFPTNSTSGSFISSTLCGVRGCLATGLIMPISCESLSPHSVAVPWASTPEQTVP